MTQTVLESALSMFTVSIIFQYVTYYGRRSNDLYYMALMDNVNRSLN